MLRTLMVAVIGLATASEAWAGGLVIWMANQVPDEKAIERVEKETGPAEHFAHVDLAFPPQPANKDDDARYEALRTAVSGGQGRWDGFEVELPIATELEGVIHTIDLVRDKRDLADLVDARMFQGAAAQKAFSPSGFYESEQAEPFREQLPGVRVNRPWLQGLALDPTRSFTRADVADGSMYPELQVLQDRLTKVPGGVIDLADLPPGATVVIDGRAIPAGTLKVDVRPGQHYVHVLIDDIVCGRQRIPIAPAEQSRLQLAVSPTELDQARTKVLDGTTTGFPDPVKRAIDTLMRQHKGPVFVAALQGGKVEVLPYARDARLLNMRRVTFVAGAEFGGAGLQSRILRYQVGNPAFTGGPSANLSAEFAVYNAVLLAGADLLVPINVAPHSRVGTADDGSEERVNVRLPLIGSPWGGLGAYVLRPTGNSATLLLAGTYGWTSPAHFTYGGRLVLGVPVQDGSWFRITLGAMKGNDLWDGAASEDSPTWREWYVAETGSNDPAPLLLPFARVGFGTRF